MDNEDLMAPIDFYDVGYNLSEYCKAFNIPKSLQKTHLSGKTT